MGLSGPQPKRLLAPSLIDFQGNPGIRALYQAIGIPILGVFLAANFLGLFERSLLLRVRKVRKILAVFEGFLGNGAVTADGTDAYGTTCVRPCIL